MKCGVCDENIYIFYYKSKKCKCKVYYHLDCIKKWYKINNVCIYCKKKDETNVLKIQNKKYEYICILMSIIYILLHHLIW